MKKSTKGAIAASTAGVLLLGGAGSLAYWTDSKTVPSSTVSSGKLSLADGTCPSTWTYAAGAANAGNVVNKFVPGDKISKVCTYTVGAAGDNIKAKFTTPPSVSITGPTPATSLKATVASTYKLDNAPLANQAVVASAASLDGKVLEATITVTFPYGTPATQVNGVAGENFNDTQNITATLGALIVSVEQQNPNP